MRWFLLHSADASAVNSIGLTAKDIAEFWLHDAAAAEISHHQQSVSATATSTICSRQSNYFCNSPLDRAAELRTDMTWINCSSTASNTVYILFVKLDLVVWKTGGDEDSLLRLRRFSYSEIRSLLDIHKPDVVFLGVERESGAYSPPIDQSEKRAWFAINVDISEEELLQLSADVQIVTIHPRVLKLAQTEASVAGHARSILAWHDRYQFCPTCGAVTELRHAGYKRVCMKQDCRSNTGLQHFFDKVIIVI